MSPDAPAPGWVRWALRLEYDGRGFAGWQRQAPGVEAPLSVQAVLEDAAAHLTAGAPVASIVAGRTDAGVHASAQVVQLDLPAPIAARQVRDALNFHMKPHAVAVLAAVQAPPGWNARFSATARHYRYRILNRRARPALDLGRVWHVPAPLDAAAMAAAARHLLGRHDFTSFRAGACQAKSPLRTLDRLDVTAADDILTIEATARSFLHHQVRNMVGSLKLVGEGRWPASHLRAVLAARDRAAAGPTAPPDGLCLTGVRYDPDPFAGRHD
ncbi:MAG: tRNA pseudouridine(38-40) synthase TruA [Rhodospirillales bacterium]|nr:tRNA pseudouridine(38-40) synthase TruA [Rhodospirillales bacterium]